MLRVHGAASPNNIPMMQAEKEKKSGIAIDKISDRYLDSFDSYFFLFFIGSYPQRKVGRSCGHSLSRRLFCASANLPPPR